MSRSRAATRVQRRLPAAPGAVPARRQFRLSSVTPAESRERETGQCKSAAQLRHCQLPDEVRPVRSVPGIPPFGREAVQPEAPRESELQPPMTSRFGIELRDAVAGSSPVRLAAIHCGLRYPSWVTAIGRPPVRVQSRLRAPGSIEGGAPRPKLQRIAKAASPPLNGGFAG